MLRRNIRWIRHVSLHNCVKTLAIQLVCEAADRELIDVEALYS